MHIYTIQNIINKKKYVGQTVRENPSLRWAEHKSRLRKNNHSNLHLQNAWNVYGEDSFIFFVLESCKSLDELNIKEQIYVQNNADGYNLRSGGNNYVHSSETCKKISASKKGKTNGQKGSIRKPLSQEHRNKLARIFHPSSYPVVISPTGEEFEFSNLREFTRLHNLTQSGFRALIEGKISNYKNWMLKHTSFMSMDKSRNISVIKRPQGFPKVISPNGTIYTIDILSKFSKEHKLNAGCLSQLINKHKSSYKGWRLLQEGE